MKTGIVMEITEGKAIILQSNGQFVQQEAQPGWQKGAVVTWQSRRASKRRWGYLAACCALLLLSAGGYQLYSQPKALVSIDVNPSIELSLNRFDRVVDARAMNPEAYGILNQASVGHERYDQALAAILTAEGAAGYLNDEAQVVLTVYAENEARQSALLTGAKESTDAALAVYRASPMVEVHEVDELVVSEAHGCGVTAGKYIYLQQLQEADPSIDITQYTHHSISQIKNDIENCRSGHTMSVETSGGGCGNRHHGHH